MVHYLSYNQYLQNTFQTKVYKLSLDAGRTCPNRDGTCGTRGCIFCSEGGSGEFAEPKRESISEQIHLAKERVKKKIKDGKYIAYFQSYTNTYGSYHELGDIFFRAIEEPDIVGLSIATRPDCLDDSILNLLESLQKIKPVTVELGLQSIQKKTADFIRRGYDLIVFEKALSDLKSRGIRVVVHIIFGLPTETNEEMLETIDYLANTPIDGIKIQVLQVLKNTDLHRLYEVNPFKILSLKEYLFLVGEAISRLPDSIVIERITGDPPKSLLVEPKWTANKRVVLNTFTKYFDENKIQQGSKWRNFR